jgi:uncharacterized protein (DUF1697 family)
MTTYIALLRGINVGGNNLVPMKALAQALARGGLTDVRTYIQSGNIVFQTGAARLASLSGTIQDIIEDEFGFRPGIMVLAAKDLDRVIAGNPFPKAAADPRTLHVSFLQSVPTKPDVKALEALKKANERFVLKGNAFYLHAPDGIGQSKLAARVEKALGVAGTSRNWRTVLQLQAMARER